MATRQELEQQVAAANAREIELYQNYQTVRRIAAEDAMFDTDGDFSQAYNIAKSQPNVYAAKLAWQAAGEETDALREQLAKIPLTPQQQTDVAAAYDNATRTTWDDPVDAGPANTTPFTTTPQTSTANNLQFTDDEEFDPTIALYNAPPSDEYGDPLDINQDGVVSDSEYLYGQDPLYEPLPTEDELADIQERLTDSAIAENVIPDSPATNEFFYLDHADELDAIAAKYGVDPTSAQAAELWEQEYGGWQDDVQIGDPNEGFSTVSGDNGKYVRPPRSIHDGRHPIVNTDWRFRISLSPYADYLYNSPNPGILRPLKATDGVIFPYTPTIVRSSETNYQQYELTHSNFRGYFYTNSKEGNIMITADFTAQDTNEAQYMLAMLHFFRSAGKMWYGQDARRGTPPPLLYLRGLGEHQFNEHACLLSTFTYTLPDNVDYIKTSNTATAQYAPKGRLSTGSGHESWSSKITRLVTSELEDFFSVGGTPTIPNIGVNGLTKITDGATYVPTKLQIQLALLPVNTRHQVSQEYSLDDFASGNLLKKGYW